MSANVSPVVEVAWVAEHLDDEDVRLVEVDVTRAAYAEGHIPGAVLWNAYVDLRHPDYSPLSTSELEDLLARSGVSAETTVVFYGYGAHLGFWLLRAHDRNRLRLPDGPREQWLEAGHSWSVEAPEPAPTSYLLPAADAGLYVSRETVEASVGSPDEVILDVRAQLEYDGDYFWPSGATAGAGRAGHMPGSVHVPIDRFRNDGGQFSRAG
jgi:thiosulfate/3-mercaptopyruvate sulfurtransferase